MRRPHILSINPGGPQQTLLRMALDFIKEAHNTSDLPVKFRCAVVWEVAQIKMAALTMAAMPEQADPQQMMKLKRDVEIADELLGEFIRKYPDYFKNFMW